MSRDCTADSLHRTHYPSSAIRKQKRHVYSVFVVLAIGCAKDHMTASGSFCLIGRLRHSLNHARPKRTRFFYLRLPLAEWRVPVSCIFSGGSEATQASGRHRRLCSAEGGDHYYTLPGRCTYAKKIAAATSLCVMYTSSSTRPRELALAEGAPSLWTPPTTKYEQYLLL